MTDTSALSILRETKLLSEDDLARLAADGVKLHLSDAVRANRAVG